MPKLRRLTKEEKKILQTRAEDMLIHDLKQDDGYLQTIVESLVGKMTLTEQVGTAAQDPDTALELLGFNPFVKE